MTLDADFKHARLLGIDLIRDAKKRWWLLEVNDDPGRIAHADRLRTAICERHDEPLARAIAGILVQADARGPVLILHAAHKAISADNADDFDAVARGVAEYSVPCLIASPDALHPTYRSTLADGTRLRSVYRRTRARLDCAPFARTINAPASARIANDKADLSCFESAHTRLVPTFRGESKLPSGPEFWISKPRFGSKSIGVQRLKRNEIEPQRGESILQPWIEPDIIIRAGRPYYYDLRVLVLDGAIRGAYARCSAAPVAGIAAGTPLEWLTTLGSSAPIYEGDGDNREAVFISTSELDLLKVIARGVAVTFEEKLASALEHAESTCS